MRAALAFALLTASLLTAGPALAATLTNLGWTDGSINDSAVADGDRNGSKEVYLATSDGTVQLRKTSSGWQQRILNATFATSVAVGDGDRDGKPEVYAGTWDGKVLRLTFANGTWKGSKVANLTSLNNFVPIETLTIGDVDDSGTRELYTVNYTGSVYKLWFSSGAWHQQRLADLGSVPTGSWVGDGDRDGDRELYVTTDTGGLWQVDKRSSGWNATRIAQICCSLEAVVVGDPDHSGKPEVYVAASDGNLHQLKNLSGGWADTTIVTIPSLPSDLAIADLNGDGTPELYVTDFDAHVRRVAFTSGDWVTTDLGDTGEGTFVASTLAAGDGDNSGSKELYVGTAFYGGPGGGGQVWQARP